MKRNKILAFALSLCLTVGLLPTLSASASVKDNNTVKIESKVDKSKEKKDTKQDTTTTLNLGGDTITPISGDMIKESKGAKSYLVKLAIKALAKAVRYGGPAVSEYILVHLDSETAAIFEEYSAPIAEELEYIATIPDVTANVVREKLYYALCNIMDSEYAETIADVCKGAINWLLF